MYRAPHNIRGPIKIRGVSMNEMIGNGFIKKVADLVQDPMGSNKIMPSIGTVINYYEDNNTVDIRVSIDGGDKLRQGVTITNSNPASKTCFLTNDHVLVLFLFGDGDRPVVVGKLDERFYEKTREDMRRKIISL